MPAKERGFILVVDDRENWRNLLTAVLQSDGHKVMTASTFEESGRLLETERFDVAILDMRLIDNAVHNIQGMALLGEVKRQHPSTKAIILTGYPDPDQEARALDFYGADGYFEKAPEGKPFDVDDFSELIFRLLRE